MEYKNFQFTFTTSQKPTEVYKHLLEVERWWSGLYNETVIGKSEKVGDEFSFCAGGGAHYSNQKLVELIPNKKIQWLVTDSKLSFLTKTDEWNNTKFGFDISIEDYTTKVTFTHEGLIPKIECYGGFSSAWTQYLKNLELKFN